MNKENYNSPRLETVKFEQEGPVNLSDKLDQNQLEKVSGGLDYGDCIHNDTTGIINGYIDHNDVFFHNDTLRKLHNCI